MLFEGTKSLMFWHVLPWKSAPNKGCFCVQTHFFTIGACLFRRELCADVKFSKKSCSEGISLGEYLTNLAAVLTRWNQTDWETLSRTGTAWVLHLRTLFNMTKESCILVFDIERIIYFEVSLRSCLENNKLDESQQIHMLEQRKTSHW